MDNVGFWKAVLLDMRAFWDVAPCSLGVDWRFRGVYCLPSPWWWRQFAPVKRQYTPRGTTWRHIPEGSHLHTCCHESLKSYIVVLLLTKQLLTHYSTSKFIHLHMWHLFMNKGECWVLYIVLEHGRLLCLAWNEAVAHHTCIT
jgi:hypothetical protein